MRDPLNDLRMRMKEALDNLWARITGKFDTVHERVDDAEAHIDDVEGELNATKSRVTSVEGRMTTAEGQITGLNTRVGDLEDAVDDLDDAMIKTISLNGVNVPKDASGNVALVESDPTVPAWAKQAKAKTSDFTNDGDGSDNNSPFATQEYVRVNEVQVNGTALPIVNKAVNVPVPTLISQLINDVGFTKDAIVQVDYGGQYISEIYPYLIDKIGNEEIRRFRANILRIGLLTNNAINVDVWGFIYRWDENNADDDIWFTMVCYEEYSGNACYYARVYSNEQDYQREIVHVDTVFQFGSGGGGSGAVDTVTFNGVTYQPDANGNVSFGFTETDPTVPSWAKAAQKPSYTATEVGAKPTQTAVADPTASGTAVAFIDSITQNADGAITPTKKTVRSASQSESGLMSATDKAKLDGIAAGAQVTSVNGQTRAVSITPANIGAHPARANLQVTNNSSYTGTPAAAISQPIVQILDSSGFIRHQMYGLYSTSGSFYTYIAARKPSGSSAVANQIGIGFDANGNGIYSVTYPEAFRSAIGVTPANIGAFGKNSVGTITDANNINLYGSRLYQANVCANLPTNNSGVYYQVEFFGTCQMAYRHSADGIDAVWARHYINDKWYPWIRLDKITGVKGNAESAYRQGNVNLTPENIGAATSIKLLSNANTPKLIYAELSKIPIYETATIHVNTTPFHELTGKTGAYTSGTVYRGSTNDFWFNLMALAGNASYGFKATVSSTSITPGTVYAYNGTAMS